MDENAASSDDERWNLQAHHSHEHTFKGAHKLDRHSSVRNARLSSSASSLVVGSRRGSIVISPTNGEVSVGIKATGTGLGKSVQFHNGNLPKGTPAPSLSSSSSEEGSFDRLPRAPDGGWGWVVVAASFLVNLIADGITFSFGVMYVEFLDYFKEGKSKTAWIGSLFMAIPLLSGPIASFLTDRYGCRKCCVIGGVLSSCGFVISAFTDSLELLFFTFGVLAGFGLSLCYVAAVVIVAYYFDTKRSFATGLSVCGSGIGTFVFAPVTQFFLTEYGWRGTTLLLAGFFLNLCVCGMLMRDLEWTKARRKGTRNRRKQQRANTASSGDSYSAQSVAQQTPTSCPSVDELKKLLKNPVWSSGVNNDPDIGKDVEEEVIRRCCSSLVHLPTFIRNGEKVPIEVVEMLTNHKHLYPALLHNYPSLLISSRSISDSAKLHRSGLEEDASKGKEQLSARFLAEAPESSVLQNGTFTPGEPWWLKPQPNTSRRLPTAAYLKDLRVHRGAMLNINRYRLRASSCPDIYRNSMTTIAKEKVERYSGLWELWRLLADMLDFSYFSNIGFLLFAISNFLLYIWYDVPYVYLADNALEQDISETDASLLIGVIGILNMVGEIGLGWAGDKEWVNPNLVYAVSMGLCGGVVALVPLISYNYRMLASVAGAFGLFIAANYALTSIILVELITLEKFTNAYGLLLLVQGVANLVGPPLAGWLYDITGTYDLSFYLAGFFIALSGVLLVIHPCYSTVKRLGKPTTVDQSEETKTSDNV